MTTITSPFPCESCGHPLNLHDPCSFAARKGKKTIGCPCQAFQPRDLKARIATLTDFAPPTAAQVSSQKGALP